MSKQCDIKITNVNPKVAEQIKNIADNLGVEVAPFLKPKLKDIVDSYSEEMKKPKSKD